MKWSITTKEKYLQLAEDYKLPTISKPQIFCFAFDLASNSTSKENTKQKFALSPIIEKSQTFPLAELSWEELSKKKTWQMILHFYPITKVEMAHYWYSVLAPKGIDAGIFLEHYGLGLHYQSYSDWKELGQITKSSRDLAQSYNLPLRILRLWNRFEAEEQLSWREIWTKQNVNKNIIQDIISNYYELDKEKRKQALHSAKKFLTNDKANQTINESKKEKRKINKSGRENKMLNDEIRKMRSPKQEERKRIFYQEKRKLANHLGPKVRLHYSEDLELNTLECRLSFSNTDELKQSIKNLEKEEILKILEDLLS